MADEPKAPGSGESEKKTSSGSLTWLWMILALITVGGFLTWLGMEAEPTSVAVVETEEEAEDSVMAAGAIVVSKDTLAEDKSRYEGRLIQVANVAATGTLGQQVFWGELGDPANQVPILVRLDSAAAAGTQTQIGAYYTLAGLLFPMSDSLAGEWMEQGLLAGEGERMQAAFADYYIQASHIRPTRASERPGAASDSAAGDSAAAMPADTAGTG